MTDTQIAILESFRKGTGEHGGTNAPESIYLTVKASDLAQLVAAIDALRGPRSPVQ